MRHVVFEAVGPAPGGRNRAHPLFSHFPSTLSGESGPMTPRVAVGRIPLMPARSRCNGGNQ